MAAPLIVLSILCTLLLAVFLPVKRIYSDFPSLALVLWLLVANFIRAINGLVWAGNVDVHSTIWCDITTKLLLGVNAAVPGAFLCIGRNLELVSSSRKIPVGPTVKRNSTIFEILFCVVLPLIYMSLHVISQDHRFDLAQDFGCSASIHPSTPALVTIWALPLILCAVALFICGLAVHHSFRMNTSAFAGHLSARTTVTPSLFFRRVATAMILTGVSAVTILFSLFSIPTLRPWTSWEDVHANLGKVRIISSHRDLGNVKLKWWTLFVISLVYVLLSFAIGEETRDSYRWLASQYSKRDRFSQWLRSLSFPVRRPQFSLPLPATQSQPPKSERGPRMVELKSGWDDMLDFKYPRSPSSTKRTKSIKSPSPPVSPASSRSPSAASMRRGDGDTENPIKAGATAMSPEDTAFMNSTISYLGSPPAQTLGVSGPAPLSVPPHAFHLPRRSTPPLSLSIRADPVLPTDDVAATPVTPAIRSPKPKTPSRPHIASVFQAEWPVPPISTPSPVMASRYETRSPTHSIASSISSDVPSYYRSRPFEGSSVPSSSPGTSDGLPQAVSHTRAPSLKRSIQSLRVSWERRRHGSSPVPYVGPDGIHMTVVREVV